MKKTIALAVALFLVTLSASTVKGFADMDMLKSVDSLMTEIKAEQGVSSYDKIDVEKVSKEMLETLGDSLMEAMINNTAIHDEMDIKLGGDGSESLTAVHTKMGYNYLVDYPNGMINLMSSDLKASNTAEKNSAQSMVLIMSAAIVVLCGALVVVVLKLNKK